MCMSQISAQFFIYLDTQGPDEVFHTDAAELWTLFFELRVVEIASAISARRSGIESAECGVAGTEDFHHVASLVVIG